MSREIHVPRARRVALAALCALCAVALALGRADAPAQSGGSPSQSCLEQASVPCSAWMGETYGDLTLGVDTPGGNDNEAAVEAVLGGVLGPPVDVEPLAVGLTRSTAELAFAPAPVTSGQSFDWSYSGSAENLAYLTVKAGDGFAVFGIAGLRSGRVDVAGLLHEISHVGFWTTAYSQTTPVTARKLHGKGFVGHARLGRIESGTVPCLHTETAEPARCAFAKNGTKSGSWLQAPAGDFALVGQPISLDGKPGGDYVVAAEVDTDGSVPAVEPAGHDVSGTFTDTALAGAARLETMLATTNASGRPLVNHATREVCTSSFPHADGAQLSGSPSPASTATRDAGRRSTTATAPSGTSSASTSRART